MSTTEKKKQRTKMQIAEQRVQKIYDRIRQIPEFARLTRLSEAMAEWRKTVTEALDSRDERIVELESQLAGFQGSAAAGGVVEDMLSVQKLGRAIRIARDPEEITAALQRLIERVIDVIDADLFVDLEEQDGYRPLVPRRQHRELNNAFNTLIEEGIVAWVIDAQKALVVDDLDTMADSVKDEERRHFLVVPVILHGSTAGIYLVYTRTAREHLTDQQLELVTLLTEHAANAIENLRLSARLKDVSRQAPERSTA